MKPMRFQLLKNETKTEIDHIILLGSIATLFTHIIQFQHHLLR